MPIFRSAMLALWALVALLHSAPAAAQDDILQQWNEVAAGEVRFDSGGVELAGSLYWPSAAPQAGLVLVHSGDGGLRMHSYARLFATQGIAVLTYDKRGLGESGGALPGAYAVSAENLDILAQDAAAALRWLAAQPELEARPVGYWGLGQAGWVAPEAAVQTPEADFLAMWSAHAMPLSALLERGLIDSRAERSDADAEAILEELRATGRDWSPARALADFGRPSLWVYGTDDQTAPTPLSVAAIQEVIDAGHLEVLMVMNEGGRHEMDLREDRGIFEGLVDWILSRSDAG